MVLKTSLSLGCKWFDCSLRGLESECLASKRPDVFSRTLPYQNDNNEKIQTKPLPVHVQRTMHKIVLVCIVNWYWISSNKTFDLFCILRRNWSWEEMTFNLDDVCIICFEKLAARFTNRITLARRESKLENVKNEQLENELYWSIIWIISDLNQFSTANEHNKWIIFQFYCSPMKTPRSRR